MRERIHTHIQINKCLNGLWKDIQEPNKSEKTGHKEPF